MCLSVSLKKTQKAKATRKPKAIVKRYKQLKLTTDSTGRVVLDSKLFSHRWTIGVNKSGLKTKPKITKQNQSIDKAIHVYTGSMADYDTLTNPMVAVNCYAKDLIAVGTDNVETYTQVYLTQAEYDRVTNRYFQSIVGNVMKQDYQIKNAILNGNVVKIVPGTKVA